MNFLKFNFMMLLATFAAIFAFSLGIAALLSPLVLVSKARKMATFGSVAVAAIAGAFQLYYWGFWSAVCVAFAVRFMNRPEASVHWLYWIAGFFWASTPLGWFASHEREAVGSKWTTAHETGTTVYYMVAVVAFVLFAFIPSAMDALYGWILHALNIVGARAG